MLSLFKNTRKKEEHPAFQTGEQVGKYFSKVAINIANYLNIFQYRVGFRIRNVLIISTLLLLLTWFIWQITTVFN